MTTEEIQLMTIYDEVNMLMEQLIAAWGQVVIICDGYTCVVEDELGGERYEATTLLEALRLAAEQEVSS